MSGTAKRATQKAANSRALDTLARLGYAVNGLVHALIGAIAISVAIGHGGEADQSGALSGLAKNPAGVVVLWIIVVGLLALGLWQISHAFLSAAPDRKRKWMHRVGELGKAVAYLFVAGTAFTFARGSSTNSASSSESFSARVLSAPGGVFLLFAVGLGIIAIGIVFVVRGGTRKFLQGIRVPAGTLGRATTVLGVVGYIAKGFVLAVVGVFFCVAAVTFDAAKATGLDGALKNVAQLPFGTIILTLLGLGLIAYGVYCLFRARFARL